MTKPSAPASLAEKPARPVPVTPPVPTPGDTMREALLGSRQRWRELVMLGSDMAFETDRRGRFTLLAPDTVLGWPADHLLGRPAGMLLAEPDPDLGFNPFRPTAPARDRQAWLRRADGTIACVSFATAPILDARGRLLGARGVGRDVSEQDGRDDDRAASLRRGGVIEHILARMRQEVMAPRMMEAALQALGGALGAEGAGVLEEDEASPTLTPRYTVGRAPPGLAEATRDLLLAHARDMPPGQDQPPHGLAPDGRLILACGCETRFGQRAFLLLWREPGARPWDHDDMTLAAAAAGITRVILEHDSIQQEMARQARTDPLTGLLNRRAFLEELTRRLDRLERDELPGTLMFIDLDYFKRINDTLGHDAGDQALCIVANLLRAAVRPFDLVARFGGDEFAVWLDGTEELSASERAELLRVEVPAATAHLSALAKPGRAGESPPPPLTLSIGIATRWPGRRESVESLVQRADQVMYDVKHAGRGHWRVSRAEAW